jgi:Uncharacterised protein conserved in bacteria (DUF2336)
MPPTTRKSLVDGPAGDPAAVVEQVTDGYLLLEDTVIAFADADHVAGLVLLIARRIGLAATTVEHALAAKSSGPATLLCRAAGLGANGFSAVLRMRHRRLREESVNPAHLLADFLQTPMEVAQGAITLMKENEPR